MRAAQRNFPPGDRRGLGLCLLRERQPRGGATARASPPPHRLRRTERVHGMRSRRATGQELSPTVPVIRTWLWHQPPGFTAGFIIVLIPRGSLYILDAVSLVLHMAWYWTWVLGFALYGRYCKCLLPFCGLLLLMLNRNFLSDVQFIDLFSCLVLFY